MVIAIVVLTGLLALLTLIIYGLWSTIKVYHRIINNDPKFIMENYFHNDNIKKKYPCKLLIMFNPDIQNGNCYSYYDFSAYEEKNVIGLTLCIDDEEIKNKFKDEDSLLIPNQVVYEMKDGSYQWDFRLFM